MKYSDWQLNRLRDALRAYKQYGHTADGKPQSWLYVREAIAAETGYEIGSSPKNGAERLRQFVEGLYIKKGQHKEHKLFTPKEEALDAIVEFVLSPDNPLLSEEELKEYVPEYHAPMRLLEYLDQSTGAERHIPVEKLEGVFQARMKDATHFTIKEITLQRPLESGLLQVIETEENYEPALESSYDKIPHAERKKGRLGLVKCGGWAVITPEDNLLFFMKKESDGQNRYYFTLAADIVSWNDKAATQLFLLHHDFPLQYEVEDYEKTDLAELVNRKPIKNILTFLRYEPAPGERSKDERAKQRK